MKNWRTTVAGMAAAALLAAEPIITASMGGPIDWRTIGIAAALAALSYLAKDAGVSGPEK